MLRRKRGRPRGWRKPGARRRFIMVRMTDEGMALLNRIARRDHISASEVIRRLLADTYL